MQRERGDVFFSDEPEACILTSLSDRLQRCTPVLRSLVDRPELNSQLRGRLRHDFGDDVAELMMTAAELQKKAVAKFGPGVWWAGQKSLQQATPWQVARLKASWFGDRTVADLCCGVGGDAMQLAQRGAVIAVDRDPIAAAMTSANLACTAASGPMTVRCDDVGAVKLDPDIAVHIDPDRRPAENAGRRIVDPDHYQPAWSEVLSIVRNANDAILKLAPAANPDTRRWPETHRVWISLTGSVREQSLLCGSTIAFAGGTNQGRSAYRVRRDASWSTFIASEEEIVDVPTNTDALWQKEKRPSEYLIDPDASIRAAGLTIAFANRYRLNLLGKPSGFLSSDSIDAMDAAARSMAVIGKVIWRGTADDRKLRRQMRCLGVYPQTIKVRGTDHDPSKLTSRYQTTGDRAVTLWIGRAAGRVYAALTEPMPRPAARFRPPDPASAHD